MKAMIELTKERIGEATDAFYQGKEKIGYEKVTEITTYLLTVNQSVIAAVGNGTLKEYNQERFVGILQDMINAMRATAGSEHDIKEKYYAGSDCVYKDMLKVVLDEMYLQPARKVTVLDRNLKCDAALLLQRKTSATSVQISKFLHMRILSESHIADSQ